MLVCPASMRPCPAALASTRAARHGTCLPVTRFPACSTWAAPQEVCRCRDSAHVQQIDARVPDELAPMSSSPCQHACCSTWHVSTRRSISSVLDMGSTTGGLPVPRQRPCPAGRCSSARRACAHVQQPCKPPAAHCQHACCSTWQPACPSLNFQRARHGGPRLLSRRMNSILRGPAIDQRTATRPACRARRYRSAEGSIGPIWPCSARRYNNALHTDLPKEWLSAGLALYTPGKADERTLGRHGTIRAGVRSRTYRFRVHRAAARSPNAGATLRHVPTRVTRSSSMSCRASMRFLAIVLVA